MMFNSPQMRYHIIFELAKFVLSLHPNSVEKTLELLLKLIADYQITRTNPEPQFSDPKTPKTTSGVDQVVTYLEAIGLLYLCFPSTKIRTIAMRFLEIAKTIDRNESRESYSLRIIDLISESETEILSAQDHNTEAEKSLIGLITFGKTESQQTQWTLCLSYLVSLGKDLLIPAVYTAMEWIVLLQIHFVHPEESKPFVSDDFRIIWRNFLVVVCPVIEPTFSAKSQKVTFEQFLSTMVFPFLKSEFHRDAVTEGLQRVPYSSYVSILEMLKPYEVLAKKDSTKKERIRLRNSIARIHSKTLFILTHFSFFSCFPYSK